MLGLAHLLDFVEHLDLERELAAVDADELNLRAHPFADRRRRQVADVD